MSSHLVSVAVAAVLFAGATAPAQTSRAVEHTLAALPQSLWFVVPPREPPKAGVKAGLVVVLPGGDGSREFLPWIENVLLAQAPADCIGVVVTAVKWHAGQTTIWPIEPG